MGKKGKKKTNKGKKSSGGKKEKVRDDTGVDDSSYLQITPEQRERARSAATNRTEDPLKNWTRPMQDECPICMLPLPFAPSENKYCVTCGKTVCMGCMISTAVVHRRDGGNRETTMEKATTCPYCRSNNGSYDVKSGLKALMKRAETGHHDSMHRVGSYYFEGQKCSQQDKAEGLKWYHRALEAGSGQAAFSLAGFYNNGVGVEKDYDKAFECLQKAAELDFIPAFYMGVQV
jgi:hypothetical protein